MGSPPIAPSYNFTIARSPRPNYNIAGDSFGSAADVTSMPATYYGSFYSSANTPADPGQFFKIHLEGKQGVFIAGTAEGHPTSGGGLRADIYDAAQTLLTPYGWISVSAYGQKTYTSSVFFNPNTTLQTST
jgi:hypothetical protein